VTEQQKKQEVVLTPLPQDKKLSEMSREEILALVKQMREAAEPQQ
jgi:hypothetical protein